MMLRQQAHHLHQQAKHKDSETWQQPKESEWFFLIKNISRDCNRTVKDREVWIWQRLY